MRLATLGAVLALVSAVGFGETFSGKLVDAACAAKEQKTSPVLACAPTASTKSFAIETAEGKLYRLDATGNSKAAAAIKGDFKPDSQVTVSGELSGQTVKVDSIDTR